MMYFSLKFLSAFRLPYPLLYSIHMNAKLKGFLKLAMGVYFSVQSLALWDNNVQRPLSDIKL